MKICSSCLIEKSLVDFHKDKSKYGGLSSTCKKCKDISNAAWKKRNIDKVNATNAAYRAANRNKLSAESCSYQAENPEKTRVRKHRWYEKNKDKLLNAGIARRKANPEKYRIHRLNRRVRKRANGGKLSSGLMEKLFKLQRGKCVCCGKPLGKDFHLDHIMPLYLGGTNTDNNIQLLLAKCNMHKNKKHPIDFMQSRGFLL